MTKKPGKGKGKSHPKTTNDRPGDNPQAAKEEASELRPNPETRSGDGDSSENILESEFESTNERDLEPQAPKSPPLTEPADNAKVDRVIPDDEPHTGAVTVLPQERAYLVSPRTLRNLFIASNVAAVSLIVVILTLASSSVAQNPGNLLYLNLPMPKAAHIALGPATLSLPILRKPISR